MCFVLARHNFACFEFSIPFSVLPLYNLLPGSLLELRQICRQALSKDLRVVRLRLREGIGGRVTGRKRSEIATDCVLELANQRSSSSAAAAVAKGPTAMFRPFL